MPLIVSPWALLTMALLENPYETASRFFNRSAITTRTGRNSKSPSGALHTILIKLRSGEKRPTT
jgi:hypothetical protein